MLTGLPLLLAWYFVSARSQAKEVKDRFGEDYLRHPWGAPLGIGVASLVVFNILVVALVVGLALSGNLGKGSDFSPIARQLNTEQPEEERAETIGRPLLEVLDSVADLDELGAFTTIIQSRLRRKQFAELDACADNYRKERTRLPG